ncbi:MAG: DUF3618 domain-containing protein [Sphingomicrobium sp.]
MSAADIRIATARGEAEAARDQLMGTVEAIKLRLAPATIAHEAWEGTKEKGVEVAGSAVTAVKDRPAIAAGVAAGVGLILARKPIIGLLSGLFSDREKPVRARKKSKE